MKRWALAVAFLYCLVLAAFTVPVIVVAFNNNASIQQMVRDYSKTGVYSAVKDVSDAYRWWGYWVWLAVMFLAQAVLLSVPVRITRGRPIARRSLLPTILASGFMMALLAFGAIFALYEFVFTLEADWGALESCATAGVVVLTWTFWSLIFMRLGRAQTPAESVSRQCRALFAGSILELLVAVPTHVVARNRGQCCGGWMTFVGLAAGLSVMVFSFGPSVFFLFAARWRRLHPQAQS